MEPTVYTHEELSLLVPAVRSFITRNSEAPKVQEAFSKYLSKVAGTVISAKRAEDLLWEMVQAGVLYHVVHGRHAYYSANLGSTLREAVGDGPEGPGKLD